MATQLSRQAAFQNARCAEYYLANQLAEYHREKMIESSCPSTLLASCQIGTELLDFSSSFG
jgi:hypothetical protein